ncbi:MAG TPA: hypothetical protein VHD81_11400 [Mycobacteriales bacterium]|nr:hypothetical protein [Mycobacteriales bacterium]
MHGRIATARVRGGSAAEVERIWRQLLEPYRATGSFHGMVAMYHNDDVAVTLTLWSSDQAADDAAARLRAAAVSAFDGILLEPPSIEKYDVLLLDVPPSTK